MGKIYGVCWNAVYSAVKQVVAYGLSCRDYHTQVYDLLKRVLLGSYPGRDNLKKIRGICCDMWAPYVKVIKEVLPHAILVFDKFHLVRHLLEAVDAVRKEEVERLRKSNPTLLKNTRYIWLKNPWNLTEREKKRLGYLEKLNLRIHRAYLLRQNHFSNNGRSACLF